MKAWNTQLGLFLTISFVMIANRLHATNIEPSELYQKWPYRIFKMHEHTLLKNSSEVCLFIDCSCQDSSKVKLNINCTQQIGSTFKFPDRIDTENFMDFNQQIEIFVLANNKFKQIPDKTFKNLRLDLLEITGNSIELIGTRTFTGIKQLNRLLLRNEKDLKVIQKGAFLPIKYLLLELDLSYNDIDTDKMDTLSTEITQLFNLQQLNLNNNGLTTVKSEWFKNLQNLDVLNLDSNLLKSVDADAFHELMNLKRISLAHNLFAGYFNQTPLEEVKNTLVRIDLSHNQITQLPTFGYLEKLRYFDFSHNQIESVESSTFTLLFNLYSLDLTANNVSYVDKNAFSTLSNLFYLRLGDNSLRRVPGISALTSLIVLDISNQNGNLVELSDFQFERKGMPYMALEINIDQNNIETFNKRVFCSHAYNDSQVDTVSMSFQTFSSIIDMNHCILTQLKAEPSEYRREWTQLNIVDQDKRNVSQQFSVKNYCNCDVMYFLANSKLNLTGNGFFGVEGCSLMDNYWNEDDSFCGNHTFIDTCRHQVNYQCNYKPPTLPPQQLTTTRPSYINGVFYGNAAAPLTVKSKLGEATVAMLLCFVNVYFL